MTKYLLILLLLLPITVIAESETTALLEREHPEASMKYVYGSVIRTFANISDNEMVMKLMTNVEVIVYGQVPLPSVELAEEQFKAMIPSLVNEQYYEVIRLKENDQLARLSELFDEISLYALKTDGDVSALFIFRRKAETLEFLDISGLADLSNISPSDITSLYKLIDTFNSSDLLNFTEEEDDS